MMLHGGYYLFYDCGSPKNQMRRIVSYRLSFRLTGKDIDLLWLDADERTPSLSVLVKKVLRGIVDGKQEVISLPAVPQKRSCNNKKPLVYAFYCGEDDEITAWLQSIEKGSRGLIIKELLRHAMETIDLSSLYDSKGQSAD